MHDEKLHLYLIIVQVLVTRYDQLSSSSCSMVSYTLQIVTVHAAPACNRVSLPELHDCCRFVSKIS